jgi:hypothetical protein
MKLIKKYWALFVAAIISGFSIVALFKRKRNTKQLDIIDNTIQRNNNNIAAAAAKADMIEDIKQDVKQDIVDISNHVDELIEQRNTFVPDTPKTAKDAKKNILNKTTKKPATIKKK